MVKLEIIYYMVKKRSKIVVSFLLYVLFPTNYTIVGQNPYGSITKCTYIIYNISDRNIELNFYPDSTFVLRDSFGCDRKYQKGKYKFVNSSKIIMQNETKITTYITSGYDVIDYVTYDERGNYLSSRDPVFIKDDTLSIINKDTIVLKQLKFVSSKESVSDLSLRAMEDYIIEKQGYDKYVTPGRGDLNETRRKLRDCW